MMQIELILLLVAAIIILILQVIPLLRARGADVAPQLAQLQTDLQQHQQQISERSERELRAQVQTTAQSTRQELTGSFAQLQQTLAAQLESMRQAIMLQAQTGREEQASALKRFGDALNQSLTTLTESNAQRMEAVRATLESKIKDLQTDNGTRLEEMRKTVDEKLHATLEQRLGESFKLVSDRLEKVHQGLGEMQQLAIGVGDLKRVLTNVKTRGTWGEVQLEMLLEQILTPEQYAKNVETVPGTGERVEFAIKLPEIGRAHV